jgi:phosphatidylglycerophosphate synthase
MTASTRPVLQHVPNALCVLRLLLVALLWPVALQRHGALLAAGILLAALTDVVDGVIARRYHVTSKLGSQLDSIADLSLMISTAAWLLLLRPDFIAAYSIPLFLWVMISSASLLVGWIRFRRVANLHLYSAKAAAVVSYAFGIWLLAGGTPSPFLAWPAIGASLLAATEALLLMSTRAHVDEHIGSILKQRALQEKRRPLPVLYAQRSAVHNVTGEFAASLPDES